MLRPTSSLLWGSVEGSKGIAGMALLLALSYGQRVDLRPTCDGQVTEARQANREALDVHLKRQLALLGF